MELRIFLACFVCNARFTATISVENPQNLFQSRFRFREEVPLFVCSQYNAVSWEISEHSR